MWVSRHSPQLVGVDLSCSITGVFVATRWNNLGGYGGPSVLLLFGELQIAESMMPVHFRCTRTLQCPVHNLNVVVCSCLARWLIGSVEGL